MIRFGERTSKVYATNAIEGFNRQLRKVTKSKSVFTTDDSLFYTGFILFLFSQGDNLGLMTNHVARLKRLCP
ncbi:MAG TPA: hypothetical protein VIM29_06620 [Bacillota bacterium]